MVKINFDKYDASCKDNVWSWNIPNRNNTKNIKVVVKFEPGISFPTSTVEDMYFEENEDFIITYEDFLLTNNCLKFKIVQSCIKSFGTFIKTPLKP